MTTLTDDQRTHVSATSHPQYFYFYMALSCVAVAFLGFAPTYFVPMAAGKFPPMPVVHFHGLLFFAWTLYFAFQSWLAASGQVMRHRTTGMIGVSLATAMVISGFLVAVSAMKRSAEIGMRDEGIAFVIVPLSGMLFFAVVFTLAIAYVQAKGDPQAPDAAGQHLAARRRGGALVPDVPGASGTCSARRRCRSPSRRLSSPISCWWPRSSTTGATNGRPHPVYVYGGIALIAVKLLNWPISTTAAWHSLAGGILAMAQ